MKKINLGCGNDYKAGWINVDFDKSVVSDLTVDLRKKLPFKDKQIDKILLQDVLEHLTKEDGKNLLKECHRILKVGGEIEIRVPDVYKIYQEFGSDPGVLFRFIYGDSSKNGELGTHKFGYSKESLGRLLKSIDFFPLSIKNESTNITCLAKKKVQSDKINSIAISLLDSGGYGGAENFIYQLSEELVKKAGKLTLLIVKDLVPDYLKAKNNLSIEKFPFRLDFIGNYRGLIKSIILSPFYLYSVLKYLLKFKKNSGQIIALPGISDKLFFTPLAKLLGIKIVWIEFGPLATVFKKNFYIPKFLYRLVKGLPDSVICPSENTKRSLLNDARISESKINVIPCGIKLTK